MKIDKDKIITKIENYNDNTYQIYWEGYYCFIDSKYPKPKVGDIITVYNGGRKLAQGIDINGKKLYYDTDEEIKKRREDIYIKYKYQKFLNRKEQMDKDYASLPNVFKLRIDKFRLNSNFRVNLEFYELMCIKEALLISTLTTEQIKTFANNGIEKGRKLIPNISEDHSGNSINAACHLAYYYKTAPNKLINLQGCLEGLTGSDSYLPNNIDDKNRRDNKSSI